MAPDTFATKADALAWLSAAETDIHRGGWTAPKAGKVTLSEYAETWLSGRSDLRPVTRSKYEHMLQRHVLPVLGPHDLARLSPSEVRSWYMAMREKYMTTADDAYRMLRAILSTAVTDGLIVKSPCQVNGAGAARSVERPVLSVAELGAALRRSRSSTGSPSSCAPGASSAVAR